MKGDLILTVAKEALMTSESLRSKDQKLSAALCKYPKLLSAQEMAGETKNDAAESATSTNTEIKPTKKKRGVLSRIWNALFRLRGDDFEKRLQYITKEEASVLARIKRRSHSSRRVARNLIILTVVLEALREKSTIIQILKQENEGLVQFTAIDEDSTSSGGSNVLKSWGYFSRIGLLRVNLFVG